MQKALIVQGGWDGHEPELTSKRFAGLLTKHGYEAAISDTLDVMADREYLEPVFTTVERRLCGLFPAILRRFPLQSVRIAAENLLVWREKSSPIQHPPVMNTGS